MLAALLFSLAVDVFSVSGANVKLGATTLHGTDIAFDGTNGIEFYGGIPYAEPPIGSLRLKPPVLKTSLDVPSFNASAYGATCLQIALFGPPPDLMSEDCLSLNIFRPTGISADASLPVMVYFFGGGFIVDATPNLDASNVVGRSIIRESPVIFVRMNYRLGPLGFPQGSEAAANGALNLGLKDQIAALDWIRANIGAFGGDKEKVTLFGTSAGAISIGTLYLTGLIEKYARGAIMQSGVAGTAFLFDPSWGQENWNNFVSAIPECASYDNHSSFQCLQNDKANITSEHLTEAMTVAMSKTSQILPWIPAIDGPGGLIPELPSEFFKRGKFPNVPFIATDTLDEGTDFTDTSVTDDTSLRRVLFEWWTTHIPAEYQELNAAIDKVLSLYSDVPELGSPFNTGNETFGVSSQVKRLSAIIGDSFFQSPRRAFTQAAVKSGVKAYGYLFADSEAASADPSHGDSHGSDLVYALGFASTPSSAALSEKIIDYYLSFVTSVDPNDGLGSERPEWPQYTVDNNVLLEINGTETKPILDDFRAEQIAFFNGENAHIFRH